MPYRYLEDIATADIAFLATGETLEELFISAADALINVMIEDLETIEDSVSRTYAAENRDLELLLFDFLQEFLFYKDSTQLMLRVDTIKIAQEDDLYRLSATFRGEVLDALRHEQRVDVKAVTLHAFQIRHDSNGWSAKVILDI